MWWIMFIAIILSMTRIYRVCAWSSADGGRRLFIKRDLARRIGKAFIPPRFFTIDEWMAYVAYGDKVPLQGSDLDHCYTIYQLAMSLCPWVCRGRESFAQFLPWAREILHFIEQLDLEDVPLDSLKIIQEHAADRL